MPETPSPSAAATTPPPEGDSETATTAYDWSAFYDGDGRLYYYNSVTGESSWEAPDQFNPPPPREEEGMEKEGEQADDEPEETAEPVAADDVPADWAKYEDEEGREYYYNAASGETQWEKPDDFVEVSGQDDSAQRSKRSPSPSSGAPMEIDDEQQVKLEKEAEDEGEEEIDPAAKRLADAEKALQQPDAVMEPDCLANVSEVLAGHGGNVGAQKATQALIDSFHSQTAVCGLLGLWLAELKSASSASEGVRKEDSFNSAADDVREAAQDMVNRIAKERFTKTGGDNILNLSKSEAAFLEEMIDSERWRKLLIDLSATNKDSALLMYCLHAISKRGHHREIAKRVNQSDHFAVFNAMLTSEFSVVATAATSEPDSSVGMDDLVEDLRRTCTSTSYTYVYAIEVLRDLVARAETEKGPQSNGAIRKWHRLREELEGAMVDPTVSSAAADSSTLFRKRRLDIALAVSELHHQQRRRQTPSSEENGDEKSSVDDHRDRLETCLLGLLRRHSLGTALDDSILDPLLPSEDDLSQNEVGKLLLTQPLAIKALLGHLFKPGSSRISSIVTRNKCARLIALAVVASKDAVMQTPGDAEDEEESEAEEITRMLLTGSQLCELLENMVSFTVSSDAEIGGDDASAGTKLCALSLKSATIAQGVIMWATEIAKNPEFVTSASYPTLSPSILSLVRIISVRHPFTRRAVLEVTLVFLRHSNSELSYQKMNAMKEQCLRLLMFLLAHGEIMAVLGSITSRLREQGKSEIDASLIRYFVGGLLDVLRPPYSLSLVRQLGGMLSAAKCIDALRSSYFGDDKKRELSRLVDSLKETVSQSNGSAAGEESSLVSQLQSIYKS